MLHLLPCYLVDPRHRAIFAPRRFAQYRLRELGGYSAGYPLQRAEMPFFHAPVVPCARP